MTVHWYPPCLSTKERVTRTLFKEGRDSTACAIVKASALKGIETVTSSFKESRKDPRLILVSEGLRVILVTMRGVTLVGFGLNNLNVVWSISWKWIQ